MSACACARFLQYKVGRGCSQAWHYGVAPQATYTGRTSKEEEEAEEEEEREERSKTEAIYE